MATFKLYMLIIKFAIINYHIICCISQSTTNDIDVYSWGRNTIQPTGIVTQRSYIKINDISYGTTIGFTFAALATDNTVSTNSFNTFSGGSSAITGAEDWLNNVVKGTIVIATVHDTADNLKILGHPSGSVISILNEWGCSITGSLGFRESFIFIGVAGTPWCIYCDRSTVNALYYSTSLPVRPLQIEMYSRGNSQAQTYGRRSYIKINGVDKVVVGSSSQNRRGFNIVILDPYSFDQVFADSYDTYGDEKSTTAMEESNFKNKLSFYINFPLLILITVYDSADVGRGDHSDEILTILNEWGCPITGSLGFRESFIFIGIGGTITNPLVYCQKSTRYSNPLTFNISFNAPIPITQWVFSISGARNLAAAEKYYAEVYVPTYFLYSCDRRDKTGVSIQSENPQWTDVFDWGNYPYCNFSNMAVKVYLYQEDKIWPQNSGIFYILEVGAQLHECGYITRTFGSNATIDYIKFNPICNAPSTFKNSYSLPSIDIIYHNIHINVLILLTVFAFGFTAYNIICICGIIRYGKKNTIAKYGAVSTEIN